MTGNFYLKSSSLNMQQQITITSLQQTGMSKGLLWSENS